jgi:hypothetical protein
MLCVKYRDFLDILGTDLGARQLKLFITVITQDKTDAFSGFYICL